MAFTPDFTKSQDGLIPAIIQDANTDKVLMLGYMNAESLEKTQKEGTVTFFSRTKNRLWTKGETTGHFLVVKNMTLDCDNDTILIKALPQGATCHTGADTCWNEKNEEGNFLFHLERVIADRKNNPTAGSYTAKLFAKGINKVAQKVGEEAIELVIEAKDNDKALFLGEAADLMYHYIVLLQAKNYTLEDVIEVLKKRHS